MVEANDATRSNATGPPQRCRAAHLRADRAEAVAVGRPAAADLRDGRRRRLPVAGTARRSGCRGPATGRQHRGGRGPGRAAVPAAVRDQLGPDHRLGRRRPLAGGPEHPVPRGRRHRLPRCIIGWQRHARRLDAWVRGCFACRRARAGRDSRRQLRRGHLFRFDRPRSRRAELGESRAWATEWRPGHRHRWKPGHRGHPGHRGTGQQHHSGGYGRGWGLAHQPDAGVDDQLRHGGVDP